MTCLLASLPAPDWLSAALGDAPFLRLGLLLSVVVLLLPAALATLLRSAPTRPSVVAALRDDSGTATIEFALVFPVAMFLALTLAQTTLLMGGHIFTHHAAFAATRTAIVQIPVDYQPAEPQNVLVPGSGSVKEQYIRRAAAFALVPVAGRANDSGGSGDFVEGLNNFFTAQGQNPPGWVGNLMADRLAYALANTTVTLLRTSIRDSYVVEMDPIRSRYTFGPRDPVTVRVEHRLHLSIPYVSVMFADGSHPTRTGRTYYSRVDATCTLTNEGADRYLPPTPTLERNP